MKFLSLLLGLFLTFATSIIDSNTPENTLKEVQKNLETSLIALSLQTINEQNFPFSLLSDRFLQNNRPQILDIYEQLDKLTDILTNDLEFYEIIPRFGRLKYPKRSRSFLRKITGRYRTDEEKIEGFGRTVSVLNCADYNRNIRKFIFYDDAMLISLIRSRDKFENLVDREPQLQAALEKHLTEACLVQNKKVDNEEEEPEVCASCLETHSLHLLKCCGKVYHKECLENWWRSLESTQPFHCPLCQRTPDEIK